MSGITQTLESIHEKGNQENNINKLLELVMTKILLENPKNFEKNRNAKLNLNVYDMFEDLSLAIKQQGLQQIDNNYRMKENYEEVQNQVQKTLNLLNKTKVIGEDGVEEVQEQGACGYMPNLLEDSKMFEWVGIYFGKDQTYQLYKSLIKLGVTKNVKSMRFWGKIQCSKKDYFIAEGQMDAGEEQEIPPNWEPRGTGVNKNTYWVTTDILGDWTELPLISPQHIQTARKIKYIFTGDLDRKVVSNPDFNGQEKHLLKTQIVRINHGTSIIQGGMFKVNEEDPKEIDPIEADEQKPYSYEQLQNLSSWVHYPQAILKEGRILHMKPELQEDEDEEKVMKAIEAKDPFIQRLKPISQDSPIQGFPLAWKLKVYNDNKNYQINGFTNQKYNFSIIDIESLVWPGSHTIYSQGQQSSIYVGYGFKASTQLYYPKEPQAILQEPQDIDEQHEPQIPKEEEVKEQD